MLQCKGSQYSTCVKNIDTPTPTVQNSTPQWLDKRNHKDMLRNKERNREAFPAEALECCPTWERVLMANSRGNKRLEMVEIMLELQR